MLRKICDFQPIPYSYGYRSLGLLLYSPKFRVCDLITFFLRRAIYTPAITSARRSPAATGNVVYNGDEAELDRPLYCSSFRRCVA